MTAGAKCSDGKCEGTGIDCQTDPDCSAWVCFDDVALNDLNAYVSGCSPKFCTDDSQCGDQTTTVCIGLRRWFQTAPG